MSKIIEIGDMYVVQFDDKRMYTMLVESYDKLTGQMKGKEVTEAATVGNPNPTTGKIILSHTTDIKYKITNPKSPKLNPAIKCNKRSHHGSLV